MTSKSAINPGEPVDRLEAAKKHLMDQFYRAADFHGLNDHDRHVLIDIVANFGSYFSPRPPAPLTDLDTSQAVLLAPQLFALRFDVLETPVAFFRRVYASHGPSLNRQHLEWLDRDLHDALIEYERLNPEDTLHELPSRQLSAGIPLTAADFSVAAAAVPDDLTETTLKPFDRRNTPHPPRSLHRFYIPAPELFADRVNRSENPIAFTRRVYADYYFSGMKRRDLQYIDPKLYSALNSFERNPAKRLHEMPAHKPDGKPLRQVSNRRAEPAVAVSQHFSDEKVRLVAMPVPGWTPSEPAALPARPPGVRNKFSMRAPELYEMRLCREETPVAFVRRVYADFYFAGLQRVHLYRIDRKLFGALTLFERKNPDRALRELPYYTFA